MGEVTGIAWCHHTHNTHIGCQRVAPGCQKCYAESYAKRYAKAVWGPEGTRVKTSDSNWRKPILWHKKAIAAGERRRVFCCSLADVFEEWFGPIHDHNRNRLWVDRDRPADGFIPETPQGSFANCRPATMDDIRLHLFRLIDSTPELDWLLLTKRPENIRKMWLDVPGAPDFVGDTDSQTYSLYRHNVFLGTSISDQETANECVPKLLGCQDLCPVLFLSAEPLLGKIDLTRIQMPDGNYVLDALRGQLKGTITRDVKPANKVSWVIIGVESNGKLVGRLGDFVYPDWWMERGCRPIVEQCKRAEVTAFVKQVPLSGLVSHDPAEWPTWAQVRQFPSVAESAACP